MNAGGKKAVLWGTALDNLVVVAHGHARCRMARKSRERDHNLGKIHDAAIASVRARTRFDADGTTLRAQRETLAIPGAAFPQGRDSARTSPTSSSPACPACRRKAATASSRRARFVLHRMPPSIRTVCLEFFGQVRDATPSIVEIKRYLDARGPEA